MQNEYNLPWHFDSAARIYDSEGQYLANGFTYAQHIVHCVNLHDDLLAALERVIEFHISGFNALSDKAIVEAKTVVARARGEV